MTFVETDYGSFVGTIGLEASPSFFRPVVELVGQDRKKKKRNGGIMSLMGKIIGKKTRDIVK